MDKKVWKILTIIFTLITLVLILLVILLPILKKNKAEDDCSDKALPKEDNMALWATFPGKLKSKIIHTFDIFNYLEDGTGTKKEAISLNEKVNYTLLENNKKEKKIKFDAKYEYEIIPSSKTKDEKFNIINLGMIETIETLANPPLYQKGINSIQYLLNKAFQNPISFIKYLFTYDIYQKVVKYDSEVKTKILKGIEEYKVDRILSTEEKYAKYSFKSILGFYQWVKILDVQEEIDKANWLKDLFDLNDNEINIIFKENLYGEYTTYNKDLAQKYKCKNSNYCGNELIYTQLITGEVINDIDTNLNGLISLYGKINPDFYPFSKSPELNLYFEEYKTNLNQKDLNYKDYQIDKTILEKLIDPESELSLLNANNSALFLSLVHTENYDTLKQLYTLTQNQTIFLCNYFYEFLPKLFIYLEMKDSSGNKTNINPVAKAFSTITENILEKTYYKINQIDNLYDLLLSAIIWKGLSIQLGNTSMEYDDKDICPLIMQQALDDGRKVLKICSDPVTAFNTPLEILKYVSPYYCIKSGKESECNMTVINHLRNIVYITEDEIKLIYEQNNLGKLIEENEKALKDAYKCDDQCDNDYLLKMQFWKSLVSLNIPEGVFNKSYTLSDILPDLLPYPVELGYFAHELNFPKEVPEESVNFLISLSPNKVNCLLNEDNYEAFNKKIELEKNYTLFMEGKNKDSESESKYIAMNLLNNGFLFSNKIENQYDSIENILQGNSIEDKKYVEFLSNGEYFENYKPGLKKTTGFNFGINLDDGKKNNIEYDTYEINTKDNKELRKILNINNYPFLNIKKLEYNYKTKDFSYITAPILNFQTLTGEKSFIDGFQYNHKEDTIYYYDKISSRPYKFKYSKKEDYEDQSCRKYILDTKDLGNNINEENDLSLKIPLLSQKLNKPYTVTVDKNDLEIDIDQYISTENYICVEPYSNMVLDSKINLIYAIYTKNYGYINSNLENEKLYPVFVYSRNYQVDIDSFNDIFSEINSYKSFRKVILIVGIILIVLFFIIACFCFYKCYFYRRKRISLTDAPRDNLINDSREQTKFTALD